MSLTLTFLSLFAQTQDPTPTIDPPVQEARVAVIGASVSAGFRLANWLGLVKNARATAADLLGREVSEAEFALRVDSVGPAELVAAAYGRECACHADEFLFSDPERSARKLLTAASAAGAPDLVLGIDLVFWFGYGQPPANRPADVSVTEWRLDLQERGLALLGEFVSAHPQTTWVLGDYPDLTGALPVMIKPSMIPTASERAELDARLRSWADARPSVFVFPLAATLEKLRAGSLQIEIEGVARQVDVDSAFQLARVHPTRLGAAVMMRELFAWLAEQPTLSSELLPDLVTDATFVAAAAVSASNFVHAKPLEAGDAGR